VRSKVWDYDARRQKTLWLHRLVMDARPGQFVDHRDGDGLNNSRHNLRLCSNAENQQNTAARKGTSGYKGVAWAKGRQKWRMAFNWKGETRFVGYFADEVEAAKAYNRRAGELCGGFARLNEV
jgi:hypothetical protein